MGPSESAVYWGMNSLLLITNFPTELLSRASILPDMLF
jgi:hypothetical protein